MGAEPPEKVGRKRLNGRPMATEAEARAAKKRVEGCIFA